MSLFSNFDHTLNLYLLYLVKTRFLEIDTHCIVKATKLVILKLVDVVNMLQVHALLSYIPKDVINLEKVWAARKRTSGEIKQCPLDVW